MESTAQQYACLCYSSMNLDPEFSRILTRVVLVGGTIGIIGVVGLLIAFRAYGQQKSDFRPVVITAAVIVFVMLACAVLLSMSFVR